MSGDQVRLQRLLAVPGVTATAVAVAAGVSNAYVVQQAHGQRRTTAAVLSAARAVARRALVGALAAEAATLGIGREPGPATAAVAVVVEEIAEQLRAALVARGDGLNKDRREGLQVLVAALALHAEELREELVADEC